MTGGYYWGGSSVGVLTSTEILTYGEDRWIQTGPLPRGMRDIKLASLDNHIYLFGKVL